MTETTLIAFLVVGGLGGVLAGLRLSAYASLLHDHSIEPIVASYLSSTLLATGILVLFATLSVND